MMDLSGPIEELQTGTVKAKNCPNCERPTTRDFCTPQCRMEDSDQRIERIEEENSDLKVFIGSIIPMCGNPDAVEACRLIVNKCQEVLNDYQN